MATKCVTFKRSAKKGGRKIAAREVCFKREAATKNQREKKAARARATLIEFACKAKNSPVEACAKISPKSRQRSLFGVRKG